MRLAKRKRESKTINKAGREAVAIYTTYGPVLCGQAPGPLTSHKLLDIIQSDSPLPHIYSIFIILTP